MNMKKKLLCGMLAALMLLSSAACNPSGPEAPTDTEAATTVTTPDTEAPTEPPTEEATEPEPETEPPIEIEVPAYEDIGLTSLLAGSDERLKLDYSFASYTYSAGNGKLDTLTYGNGISEYYVYNDLGQISEIKYDVIVGQELQTVTDEYGSMMDVYVDVTEIRTL